MSACSNRAKRAVPGEEGFEAGGKFQDMSELPCHRLQLHIQTSQNKTALKFKETMQSISTLFFALSFVFVFFLFFFFGKGFC